MPTALIPAPKHQVDKGTVHLPFERPIAALIPADCSPFIRAAAQNVLSRLTDMGFIAVALLEAAAAEMEAPAPGPYRLRFVPNADSGTSERYGLETDAEETRFCGSPRSMLHAVETWLQLLSPLSTQPASASELGGVRLTLTSIEDAPDMPVRGVFVECFIGSDLMKLDDWHRLIDELVSLKLNTLSIGINGAWPMRYDEPDSRLDFLFVPLIDDPERVTGRQLSYYDPTLGEERTIQYEMPIYAEDLLGDIMAYAAERGVRTIPLFNGPGHTTVLSQLYPHISAKDANGNPTGFGYSFSHPETMGMLKRIYTRLVERYMRPNRQTWVHIGCDEVAPFHYMNERMSSRAVSPWCSEDMLRYSKKELLHLYIRELGTHLVGLGMDKIIIWHDALHGMGGFDEDFERMLEESGLAGKLTIHWWRYHEPPLSVQHVRGAENWVAPATGYFPNIVYQDFLDNIDIMVNEGVRVGASAAVSYAVYAPNQHRNTAFLAEKSWNTASRVVRFEERYARWLCGDEADAASVEALEDGFRRMRQVYGQYGHCYFLIETSIYFGNYYPRKPYPARVLNSLANNEFAVETLSRLLALDLDRALSYFAQAAPRADRAQLLAYNVMDCTRTKGVLDALVQFGQAVRLYEQARVHHPDRPDMFEEAYGKMEQADKHLHAALLAVCETHVEYWIPASLREFTPLARSIRETLAFLAPWRDAGVREGGGNGRGGDAASKAAIAADTAAAADDDAATIPPLPIDSLRLTVYPHPRAADLDEA
ncbi:family 20 glycosylhydrolase [Paenibacillus koleovorans]|uniref:family 20 glycosylhydrolase n=1 Tax=Paenibacillus koleovorans TaxID=121608 RepID=UPI000FDA58BA|nr:family 20 glycosylhydrolase [Paenibacillus koleovorans]